MAKIISSLIGGLGNQMFCIAQAVALADKLGCSKIVLDGSFYRSRHNTLADGNSRSLNWNHSPKVRMAIDSCTKGDRFFAKTAYSAAARSTASTFLGTEYATDYLSLDRLANLGFKARRIVIANIIPSAKFLSGNEECLRELFWPKNVNVLNQCSAFLSALPRPILGVHLRRGDYNFVGSGFDVIPVERVNSKIAVQRQYKTVVVVSDSPSSYEDIRHGNVVPSPFSQQAWADQYLLGACDGVLIANSTFSWWPAFLLTHPKAGKVFFPMEWSYPEHCHASLPLTQWEAY